MLRLKILASTIPLVLAAFFARGDLSAGTHPCIATGETTLQMASAPWQPQAHVSFTDDPALATVRVQIVDSADAADFAVLDDVDSAEPGTCSATAATRFIGIADLASGSDPVIYLSDHGNADYRIFVKSRSFTPREAAALLVGARGNARARMATAALQEAY
jgi:hypothetical protein